MYEVIICSTGVIQVGRSTMEPTNPFTTEMGVGKFSSLKHVTPVTAAVTPVLRAKNAGAPFVL